MVESTAWASRKQSPKTHTPCLKAAALLASVLLAGCQQEDAGKQSAPLNVEVEAAALNDDLVLAVGTGEVRARVQSDLSFKISGRITARNVGVGDHVKAGDVLATVDPAEQQADIDSARAAVMAAQADLRKTSSALSRRNTLMQSGVVARQEYDSAVQEFQSAQNSLDVANAQLATAQDALQQTELRADADGVITARNAETGQVIQASTAVFTLAHDGERDAVFNIQEAIANSSNPPAAIEVSMISRPDISTGASIREMSPAVDRSTGTVRIKLAITHPPKDMTLGAAVMARVRFKQQQRISVPWQAIFIRDGKPAVWTVNRGKKTAEIKPVILERYDTNTVVLSEGLQPGELVVVGGNQFLRQGQIVTFAEGSSK